MLAGGGAPSLPPPAARGWCEQKRPVGCPRREVSSRASPQAYYFRPGMSSRFKSRLIHRTHDHTFLIHFFIKISDPPPAAPLPTLPAVILDSFAEVCHKVSHRLRRGASLMALFGAWKHSRRISRAEERLVHVALPVAALWNDTASILNGRQNDPASPSASLRWA